MSQHSPYLPSDVVKPMPRDDSLDTPYWDALRDETLRIQRCGDCATAQWGPEWICHRCLSENIQWVDVPARGIIYSWERPWHPASSALAAAVPYIVVLIELSTEPGVRMVGNLLGDPLQQVQIGAEVTGVFEHHDDCTLLQWTSTTGEL